MVECQQIETKIFKTERRVIKSIKKFTNEANVKCLVLSGAKYSHNQMDGKVSFLAADQLVQSDQNQTSPADLPT